MIFWGLSFGECTIAFNITFLEQSLAMPVEPKTYVLSPLLFLAYVNDLQSCMLCGSKERLMMKLQPIKPLSEGMMQFNLKITIRYETKNEYHGIMEYYIMEEKWTMSLNSMKCQLLSIIKHLSVSTDGQPRQVVTSIE